MTVFPTWLLPDAVVLHCDDVVPGATDRTKTLYLRTIAPTASCPQCHALSRRVHSRYTRSIADLPLAGIAIQIVLRSIILRPWCMPTLSDMAGSSSLFP